MEKKVAPVLAMIIVSLGCFERGVGGQGGIFSDNFAWVWFVIGAIWIWMTVDFIRS